MSEAREVARDWLNFHHHWTVEWSSDDGPQPDFLELLTDALARYAAQQRLEEAKWWRDKFAGGFHDGQVKNCKACERIATLEREVGTAGKGGGK
jgi:hypothetical protein